MSDTKKPRLSIQESNINGVKAFLLVDDRGQEYLDQISYISFSKQGKVVRATVHFTFEDEDNSIPYGVYEVDRFAFPAKQV